MHWQGRSEARMPERRGTNAAAMREQPFPDGFLAVVEAEIETQK
jgi:hypothetical protein